VKRFGFRNLRHSLASFFTTKKKTDVKTVQGCPRHAKSTTTLDKLCANGYGRTGSNAGADCGRHFPESGPSSALEVSGPKELKIKQLFSDLGKLGASLGNCNMAGGVLRS